MEWVETTGKSVEEATEVALEQLGVLEGEAELQVLEEPRQGMFGRVRGSARVKARIRPTSPPPKQEKRRRGKKAGGSGSGGSGSAGNGSGGRDSSSSESSGDDSSSETPRSGGRGSRRSSKDSGSSRSSQGSGGRRERREDREPMPEAEQRSVGEGFLNGYLEAIGYEAEVSSSLDDEGILLFQIDGEGLGLIIGPGLNTLDSLQEICRNAIQRQADGREYGKVVLDVSSARRDRAEALEKFVRDEASQVSESGEEVIFEVMSRADRKIVHDVVADIDGVATESVGEDPRRRVVLRSN